MSFDPLTAILDFGGKVLERVIPDPAARAAAQIELAKLEKNGELTKLATDADLKKAFLADTQSARQRDVAIVQARGKNARGDVLAYSAMGALIVCIVLLFGPFGMKPPPESRDLLLVTLGALVAIVKDVFGFEFGSSKDSQRNAQAVSDMLSNKDR